jgi:hypothetical protein
LPSIKKLIRDGVDSEDATKLIVAARKREFQTRLALINRFYDMAVDLARFNYQAFLDMPDRESGKKA